MDEKLVLQRVIGFMTKETPSKILTVIDEYTYLITEASGISRVETRTAFRDVRFQGSEQWALVVHALTRATKGRI